jgi:hypothetical protein
MEMEIETKMMITRMKGMKMMMMEMKKKKRMYGRKSLLRQKQLQQLG